MLHVAAFAVSSYAGTNNRTLKPFNPLLGETFEFQYPEQNWRGIAEKVRATRFFTSAWGFLQLCVEASTLLLHFVSSLEQERTLQYILSRQSLHYSLRFSCHMTPCRLSINNICLLFPHNNRGASGCYLMLYRLFIEQMAVPAVAEAPLVLLLL